MNTRKLVSISATQSSWGGARLGAGRPRKSNGNGEPRGFSLSAAIRDLLNGGELSGLEAELDQEELARRQGLPLLNFLSSARAYGSPSIALPMGSRQVSVGGSGGFLVGEEKRIVASDLIQFSAVVDAGSTVLENLKDNLSLAWMKEEPTVSWVPELGFSIESSPAFESLGLSPRRVSGMTVCSNQMLVQAGPSFDEYLLAALSKQCSSQLDQIALYGRPDVNPNQPRGVKYTAGIQTLDAQVQPLWDFLTEAERLVEEENVPLDSFGFITSPSLKKLMQDNPRWTTGDTTVWEAISERGFSSNEVDTNEIFFGAWDQLVIAIWSADIVINPYSRAGTAMTELIANLFCSVGIRRPACFGIVTATVSPPPYRNSGNHTPVKVNSGGPKNQHPPTPPAPEPEPEPKPESEPPPPTSSFAAAEPEREKSAESQRAVNPPDPVPKIAPAVQAKGTPAHTLASLRPAPPNHHGHKNKKVDRGPFR